MQFEYETVKISDENYPFLLKEIPNPPASIYLKGKLPDERKIKISIVGTRKATIAGRMLAKEIAQRLANFGIVIVSGLALGIDTAAHEGAISNGGETIAVLGRGVDRIYPSQNEGLAKEILLKKGAIISEYKPGTPPLPKQFLERNRIVAGLSVATIVIEAPRNSGAIVTARLAAEAGREVLVFPGPANHPNFAGSHKLIRDGASLVSSFEDIIEDLNLEVFDAAKEAAGELIIHAIQKSESPIGVDKISELTKLEPQIVNSAVAFLEANKMIKRTDKGYII